VAVSPDGKHVFVANQNSGDVSVVDTQTLQVIARIKTGAAPTSIAASPDWRRLYVANMYSGNVSVIDTNALRTVATTPVIGDTPRGIAVGAVRDMSR
jgi:YVTN family beta-propeller protein